MSNAITPTHHHSSPTHRPASRPPAGDQKPPQDSFQPTRYEPAIAHLKAMRALAELGGLTQAESSIDQALASLETARTHNAVTEEQGREGSAELDNTAAELRTIKFDRHTHDVSGSGRALRGMCDGAVEHAGAAGESQALTVSAVEELEGHIEQALAQAPDRSRARSYLSRAQRDLELMKEHGLDTTSRSIEASKKVLGEIIDPYLVEVEEDAPGRDVGRYADDLREILSNGRSNLGMVGISADYVERDLAEIEESLRRAREAL